MLKALKRKLAQEAADPDEPHVGHPRISNNVMCAICGHIYARNKPQAHWKNHRG